MFEFLGFILLMVLFFYLVGILFLPIIWLIDKLAERDFKKIMEKKNLTNEEEIDKFIHGH